MNIAVANLYPNEYWGLTGVNSIEAPPELWWSSRERQATEGGLPTSDYLELDYGRLRSLNFLNFNVLMKPIDITIEYDVWGFDSGVKKWQPVTRIANERFDNSVSFTPNSANPWKNCQFYFTNAKGDLLSTRYLRIRYDRRDEPWPNGNVANTFPWSIDVKSLRTSRYVIDLNDTRGVLVQQGKVTAPIVDPTHYSDIITDIPKVIGIPSGVDDYSVALGHDNETYLAYYAGLDASHGMTAMSGGGGLNVVLNANAQDSTSGTSIFCGFAIDTNEAGHAVSDLPVIQRDNLFVFSPPTDANVWFYGLGDITSVGIETTTLRAHDQPVATPAGSGTSVGRTFTLGASTPNAGDLMTLFIGVSASQTLTYTALISGGWVLQAHDSAPRPNGFTGYLFTRVCTGSEGASYALPTSTISGDVAWGLQISLLGTPSSHHAYLMDEGVPSLGGSDFHYTAIVHGT